MVSSYIRVRFITTVHVFVKIRNRGRIQKIYKEGAESLPLPPPQMKTLLFAIWRIQQFECIRDAK